MHTVPASLGFARLAAVLAALGVLTQLQTAAQGGPVPTEVRALVGIYTGSWTTFGIDSQGKVVPRASWTDTMKAESPVVKDGRAFVTTTDEMVFPAGRPPLKVAGTEGYFLKPDGSLGDYFIESFGQTYRLLRLGPETWAYSAPADGRELRSLGFPDGAAGEHALVKVVSRADGMETHRITRLTTVSWKDGAGKRHWLQFTSLQGTHTRPLRPGST